MLEIQRSILIKATKLLNSIGVEYAIVVGDEKYGTLEVVKKKPVKSGERAFSQKYGRGTVLSHVKPYIDNLSVGEVTHIPAGEYELAAVATSAASYAYEIFGKGGHTGRKDKEKNVYEVLRLEV